MANAAGGRGLHGVPGTGQARSGQCKELGLHSRPIGAFTPTVAGGEKAAEALLQRRTTTAALTYNDQVAIGVIRRLTAKGVRVPEEFSVIGFDNIFAADLITPPLTAVAAPLRRLGLTAVRNMLAMINGSRTQPSH